MKLYFDRKKLVEIIEAIESGSEHHRPYTGPDWGCGEDSTPGILLVGDEGVYIIGNEKSEEPPSKSGLIAYAYGCDPKKDDDWWENKQASFGGDDGAEFLELGEAKRLLPGGQRPFVEITPNHIVWGS